MRIGVATTAPSPAEHAPGRRRTRVGWAPWNKKVWPSCRRKPIGTQEISAENFSETREVGTGSWLGARVQGQGYGTEQRAAVLELAFRGLGAEAATSGALERNIASQRVSAKLGYR